MNSSANLRPRKRKQCSSSNPVNGRFTRSKSRVHVHCSRSGRTWMDTLARKPFDEAQLLLGKRLEKPRIVNRPLPENEASLDLSIKDLRTRARRVFSPTSVVVEESQKFKVGIRLSEEVCNGVLELVDDCKILDLGFGDSNLGLKDSDMDSDLGFACSGKEEHGGKEDVGPLPVDEDPVLRLECHGQSDKEEDVNLNEKTPVLEKKNEGNNAENGKGCSESKINGSISGSRSVLNFSSKRKVFKAPSSFSYRRLLPFLMETAEDDSSISKFDVVDIDYTCKVQNLNNVDSNLPSALTECYAGKSNNTDVHSYHTKALDEGDYRNSRFQLPINGQDFDDPTKIAKTEENIEFSHMEQRNHENGMNEVDAFIEDFLQTTPPDDFSKLDNNNVRQPREFSAVQNGNHVLEKPSIGNNSSNGICISMKPHPARKSNSISNAKLVLNPCSRSKIFKSSSFSYRRLLPFLTDVAKSTANIDEPPKFQREEDDSHSVARESVDENVPLNNPPTSGTSHDAILDVSAPFFSSGDSLLNENSNAASSKAIAKPDDMQISKRTSQYELVRSDSSGKLEIELSANVIKSCNGQNSCSVETSCSTIHQESFTRESNSDASQLSDTKKSMALGLDYDKDKLQLVKSVSLCQSLLETEEFDHQGNQSDSPTKGILKRNPRGCRGLCNCLDCSSFRLHADRSFEFSKNQMLDAEEVAHGLINELSKLRSLLEKSVFCDRDLIAVQINQPQAKEACKSALRSEQLAKDRLSQMNYDLKIHCRIRPLQRPRVTFSRHIEEIAIPKRPAFRRALILGNKMRKKNDKFGKPALSKNVLYECNMPAGSRGVVGSSTSSSESADCS